MLVGKNSAIETIGQMANKFQLSNFHIEPITCYVGDKCVIHYASLRPHQQVKSFLKILYFHTLSSIMVRMSGLDHTQVEL